LKSHRGLLCHTCEKAIEIILNAPPKSKSVFLHRDYHPLNILWQQSKITGVVDWTNSCQGPAGVDVAHCRTNLIQMLGSEHADQFLKAYQAASPSFIYHPYWDISSVLDMCWPKPEFYKPWQDFGISMIEDKTLQTRIDDYLNYLVKHYEE